MTYTENPNAPTPQPAGDYSRQSVDFQFMAWYAASPTIAFGNAFRSWSQSPSANPSRDGTIHTEEDVARQAVDLFMDVSVFRQREERARHTLPTDRVEYVNGVLTIIDTDPQFNHYFVAPEHPKTAPGSVGTVEAVSTGLGRYYLRRQIRLESGELQEQYPNPQVQALLEPLYTADIHANSWGADDEGQYYPVASDIANTAYPSTWPHYEPRRLPQEEEQMVLQRRRAGLPGDPIAGRPNEEEKLYEQYLTHLDDAARQRDVSEKSTVEIGRVAEAVDERVMGDITWAVYQLRNREDRLVSVESVYNVLFSAGIACDKDTIMNALAQIGYSV